MTPVPPYVAGGNRQRHRLTEESVPLKALPAYYAVSYRRSIQRQQERTPYLSKQPRSTFAANLHPPHRSDGVHTRQRPFHQAPDDIFEYELAKSMSRAYRAKL